MKCKNCTACVKGYYETQPNKYFCIGVKHPFEINNINSQCTEYPEKNVEYINIEDTQNNIIDELKFILDILEKSYSSIDITNSKSYLLQGISRLDTLITLKSIDYK